MKEQLNPPHEFPSASHEIYLCIGVHASCYLKFLGKFALLCGTQMRLMVPPEPPLGQGARKVLKDNVG